jgi:hypothetical protein
LKFLPTGKEKDGEGVTDVTGGINKLTGIIPDIFKKKEVSGKMYLTVAVRTSIFEL